MSFLQSQPGDDPVVVPLDALAAHWPAVSAGVPMVLPGIDGGAAVSPSADGVRFGSARLVSFSPTGGATAGTLYLAHRTGAVVAVRVTGTTGRIRMWRFDRGAWQWRPC